MNPIARLLRWFREDDLAIDVLIEERGVQRYRPGMDRIDWGTLNRVGARRWQQVLKAQRTTNKPDVREFPRRVNER